MCELLGVSSRERRRLNGVLREFFSHASAHPHGWGLARFGDAAAPSVEKEPACATQSGRLGSILAGPVEERALIGHIRLATIGHIEYSNCHPFTAADNSGRVWTLAHNGTIFSGAELNAYLGVQYGETDSERVLLHIVDEVDRAQARLDRALDGKERFDILFAVISRLAKGNKLNLLIHDGEFLYAHSNYRGALSLRRESGSITFSTRPLSGDGWTQSPLTCLVAVRDGEIVRTSPPHGSEYIYNPDDYRMLYIDFAGL